MSTVGLTKAQRLALESLRDYGHWPRSIRTRAMRSALNAAGLVRYGPTNPYELTPRDHAALAAPRMTDEQYTALALIEGHGEAVVTHPRVYATFVRNGWVSYRRITPAGRTALNNVRAAMPGDWP